MMAGISVTVAKAVARRSKRGVIQTVSKGGPARFRQTITRAVGIRLIPPLCGDGSAPTGHRSLIAIYGGIATGSSNPEKV